MAFVPRGKPLYDNERLHVRCRACFRLALCLATCVIKCCQGSCPPPPPCIQKAGAQGEAFTERSGHGGGGSCATSEKKKRTKTINGVPTMRGVGATLFINHQAALPILFACCHHLTHPRVCLFAAEQFRGRGSASELAPKMCSCNLQIKVFVEQWLMVDLTIKSKKKKGNRKRLRNVC